MILATPFVPGLVDWDEYATLLKKRGENRAHLHLVLARPEDEPAAIDFDGEVAQLFAKSICRVVTPPQAGNRALANAMFREAVKFLSGTPEIPGGPADAPLLYSDPAWKPAGLKWLDAIQFEFYSKGMPPVLGRLRKTGEEAGTLWGPLVIGRSYTRAAALLDYMPHTVHWRDYLKHEIGRVMVESEKIGRKRDAALKPPPGR